MTDKDFIGNRGLNDYTANNANTNTKKKFVEPKKVAMCIASYSPMDVTSKITSNTTNK